MSPQKGCSCRANNVIRVSKNESCIFLMYKKNYNLVYVMQMFPKH